MIGVMGAGAFGTALAIALAQAGRRVTLWARSSEHISEMQARGQNARYLPGNPFLETLSVTDDLTEFADAETVLIAVPLQSLRAALSDMSRPIGPLVACCKGIELSTGMGATQIIKSVNPDAASALLTGPSFAADIAIGRPTALTLACAQDDVGARLQSLLTTPTLRLYRTTDTIGAELGGALKNVMAIACGAVIGAGLGDSARAATLTRGFAEMQRVGHALGADPDTLAGLSGLGDLALTCTSDLSRNYRLGQSLGQNIPFDPSVTVEGAATARAMLKIAEEKGLEVPITKAVTELLDGTTSISEAITQLMARPLKEE